MPCNPSDLNCILAAGKAGTNLYQATNGGGSVPNVNSPPSGFIESALAGVKTIDSWVSDHIDAPIKGAAGDTYGAVAGPVNAVYQGAKFLADPPRVAVTVIGFLLIAGGIFTLGRNQILQMVKP